MKPLFALLALGLSTLAADTTEKTVTGWVLDSACAFTKGLTKPISRDCALACARKGSQLVILQNDGSIYWPISDQVPAEGQNQRLLPFAGKRVTITGKVYTRGGSNALVIEKIAGRFWQIACKNATTCSPHRGTWPSRSSSSPIPSTSSAHFVIKARAN